MAKLSKATILPMGIWGTEKLLPINESNMASERFHHADVNIKIGDPIMLRSKKVDEDKTEYYDTVMNEIMSSIAVLLPEQYRGVYSIGNDVKHS